MSDVHLDRPSRRSTASGILGSRRVLAKALFLLAGTIAFLLSVWLWFSGEREQGLFVGLWVPSLFSLGALVLAADGEEGR